MFAFCGRRSREVTDVHSSYRRCLRCRARARRAVAERRPVTSTRRPAAPAAVALGDSFISGEGAGAYQPVVDLNGCQPGLPRLVGGQQQRLLLPPLGQRVACTRPPCRASSDRFNLACSGGQPHDIANASAPGTRAAPSPRSSTSCGRSRQTHDIDLVLVGLGSNNSSFTFGDVAAKCANRFIADAWTGWWEFWASSRPGPSQEPVHRRRPGHRRRSSPPPPAETTAALRQLLDTLDQIDADGQHRVVLQDYTNPLPFDVAEQYLERGRPRRRPRQVPRPRRRAVRGRLPDPPAPASPRPPLLPGPRHAGAGVADTLRAEFPGEDLVYLNVQHAFDGARLCENAGSPATRWPPRSGCRTARPACS